MRRVVLSLGLAVLGQHAAMSAGNADRPLDIVMVKPASKDVQARLKASALSVLQEVEALQGSLARDAAADQVTYLKRLRAAQAAQRRADQLLPIGGPFDSCRSAAAQSVTVLTDAHVLGLSVALDADAVSRLAESGRELGKSIAWCHQAIEG